MKIIRNAMIALVIVMGLGTPTFATPVEDNCSKVASASAGGIARVSNGTMTGESVYNILVAYTTKAVDRGVMQADYGTVMLAMWLEILHVIEDERPGPTASHLIVQSACLKYLNEFVMNRNTK